MRNVIAVNVLMVLGTIAQISGAYYLISNSEAKSDVIIAEVKVAHKFPVTQEGLKLPNESYKPISLILGFSIPVKVGFVVEPNSPLAAIHVIF